MRIALAGALAVVVATPVLADAPIEWVTRFAFLHAVKAERLPPGPESLEGIRVCRQSRSAHL